MKLENHTRTPDAALRPLIAFALNRAGKDALLARFRFRQQQTAGATSSGLAHMHYPGSASHPSLIEIFLSPESTQPFPFATQHVPEIVPFVLNSWTEEVLLVIAHEIRHIDQFWGEDDMDEHVMEVDAEAFAISTVKAWRVAQKSNLKKAA